MATTKHFVSVQHNRVCCESVAEYNATPCVLWELLACTESRPVFRVEGRKQLSCKQGVITEQVVFVAPVRILFWKKWSFTEVHQTVDLSDSSLVKVDFTLLHSDMMSHLTGSWRLQQLQPASKTSNGRTRVTYCFEMWPKGVPTALRFMPGLLDAVKAAVAREAGQLLEKLAFVASKVQPGGCVLAAARQASAEVEAAGGSYKCLLLQQSGDLQAAAAAAASEASAKQTLKRQLLKKKGSLLQQQQQKQQQPKVLCHALDDVSSDDVASESDDEFFVALDGCSSDVCSMASSTIPCGSDISASSNSSSSSGGSSSRSSSCCCMSEPGSERVSDSSNASCSSCGRGRGSSSAGGSCISSVESLVEAMSTSFEGLLQPAH